jgi:hypothetical protein
MYSEFVGSGAVGWTDTAAGALSYITRDSVSNKKKKKEA